MMQKALGDKTIGPEGAQVHPTSLLKPDDRKAKAKFLDAEVLRGVRGLACDAQKRRVWRNSRPGYWECLSWKRGCPQNGQGLRCCQNVSAVFFGSAPCQKNTASIENVQNGCVL